MAYGDIKRQVEALLYTAPAGLTTQQIYQRANATTAGEQALIRGTLRKLAKSRTLLRTASRPAGGRGGSTFTYFPRSPEGRANHDRFSSTSPVVTTERRTYARSAGYTPRIKHSEMRQRVLDVLQQHPNGLTAVQIGEKLGRKYDSIRNVVSIMANKRDMLRIPRGTVSTNPDGRGGTGFMYFPKTPEGRVASESYRAAVNGGGVVKARQPAPRVYHSQPEQTITTQPINGTPAFNRTVEALVRITLPDGTHEVPFDAARQLQRDLTEVFG